MKKTLRLISVLTASIGLISAANAVVVSDLEITDSTFSVTFSGVLPSSAPSSNPNFILAVNPDQFASPGFAIGDFIDSSSASFTGTQDAGFGRTGGAFWGDYLLLNFTSALSTLEDITGTFSASWGSSVFDPSVVSSLDFYWGSGGRFSNPVDTIGGEYLGSARVNGPTSSVPDTGYTALMLGLSLGALLAIRRKFTA